MLYNMARDNFFKKNRLSISHIPSVFLLIGYIVYWIELYWIKLDRGRTSFLVVILFGLYFTYIFYSNRKRAFSLLSYYQLFIKSQKRYLYFFVSAAVFILAITAVVLLALFHPPHLTQEFDSLNYHLTIPKQHLILHSFKHIRWSAADLFLFPLQFALAPYWLVTELPNKFPQLLFVFGLPAVSIKLLLKMGKTRFVSIFILILAIFGSHNVGIQMPVLMLDLVICYLFLAAADSFLEKRYILSSVELAFFVWAKPFLPVQTFIIFVSLAGGFFVVRKIKSVKICLGFNKDTPQEITILKSDMRRIVVLFLAVSFLIAGPFILKSLYYAGTPLFPFFPGTMEIPSIDKTSSYWESIAAASKIHFSARNAYGSGRSVLDFLKHLWLVAVPEEGVMNRFDYPVGLPYLLFLCPFLFLLINSLRKKVFPLLPFFAVAYWGTWWMGSQQARFLYIPIILIFITVTSAIKRPSNTFIFILVVSLGINFLSIFRAHYRELFKPKEHLLRMRDKALIKESEQYYRDKRGDVVVLDFFDAAYADFPIKVILPEGTDTRWVFKD